MGCGSSKATAVASAPQKVIVASAPIEEKHVSKEEPVSTSTPTGKSVEGKEAAKKASNSPGDSGLEVQGIITEDTAGGEEIAGQDRPITPELELAGVRPAARATREPDSDIEADETLSRARDTSAVSTRSAPIILQRPSSRGGSAFDISFEGESAEPATPGLPKRLQQRDSSGRKKREDMTLEELQAKLAAADQRRRDIESRLKEKMAQESSKGEQIRSQSNSLNGSLNGSLTETSEKEKAALDNREAHLRQLRERLRAKEDRARQVREKKKALAAAGGSTPAISTTS